MGIRLKVDHGNSNIENAGKQGHWSPARLPLLCLCIQAGLAQREALHAQDPHTLGSGMRTSRLVRGHTGPLQGSPGRRYKDNLQLIFKRISFFRATPLAYWKFPGQGSSALQLPAYTTATEKLDPSHICDLCCSL